MSRFVALFALVAFAAVSATDIKFDGSDADKTVLLSFGDAACTVSVLYKGPDADAEVSGNTIFSAGDAITTVTPDGYTNYTIPFNFDNVGSETYTVTIGSQSIAGKVTSAGFVILDGGKIVSGDSGEGVSVGQDGTTSYDVKVVGVDGTAVDISGTSISAREMSGPYMKEVAESKTKITSDTFTLAISEYRVGTGSFIIDFETDAIVYKGESFETVLNVKQETSPEPPCVAVGGDISASNGIVMVPMFNLLTPPKSSPVKTVTITIGSESADWDRSASSLTLPDQKVAFKISASGKASITCDGADAVILGDDIDVTGDGSTSTTQLATDLISELPKSDSQIVFSAKISVTESDPSTLSFADGKAIFDKFCGLMQTSTACALVGVTKGSAVLALEANVDEDVADVIKDDLEREFKAPDCLFQTGLGYTCPQLKLLGSEGGASLAGTAAAGAGGAGLAVWTIVLIACVGAFALILVIVLGLWAVYRRSSEQSESDYSSSGPLGVPDPSDLLYEQSIVRDIYGRGDFPDGGPSQAVAEQRAREADLREEFPRPPSSSGLSRGAATDDASSTYSV